MNFQWQILELTTEFTKECIRSMIIYLYIHPSIYLSIYLPTYLSTIYLFINLSTSISIFFQKYCILLFRFMLIEQNCRKVAKRIAIIFSGRLKSWELNWNESVGDQRQWIKKFQKYCILKPMVFFNWKFELQISNLENP